MSYNFKPIDYNDFLPLNLPFCKTTLLWENPSPTSNFSHQSISISGLRNYDYLIITSKMLVDGDFQSEKTYTGYHNTTLVKVELEGDASIRSNLYDFSPWIRNTHVLVDNKDEIYFSDAFIDGTNQPFNNHCIPLKIIGIKLYGSNELESPTQITNKYSTEEIVVGEWIDGKPIYRKVVPVPGSYTISIGSEASLSVVQSNLPTNVSRYINSVCMTYDSPSSLTTAAFGTILVKNVNYANSTIAVRNVGISDSIIIAENTTYIILEYTKTTD